MAADKTTIHCPLCGNAVAPGVTKCPVCATDLEKTISKRKAQGKESAHKADYLHKELPKVELPKASVTCPQCALQLQGGEDKCPRCGIPLAGEKEMLECPQCGGLTPRGSKSCPSCGIGFEEAPEVPASPLFIAEEIPPPPEPPEPAKTVEPAPEVVTEIPAAAKTSAFGLTNGRGAINGTGLTNGRGAINGTGLTNGRGAVNGTGLVNGTGMSVGGRPEDRISPPSTKHGSALFRWQFLAVLIALAIVIPTFVFLSYSGGNDSLIDGDFDEWADVDTFGVAYLASSPNVAIEEWAVRTDANKLYMYIMVQGEIMSSTEVDSFFLFVDSDNDANSGYLVSGIGADYLLEVDGWDGEVRSTALKEYGSAADQYDWNSWVKTDSLASAIKGSQLEALALMPSALPASSKYMLQSQDNLADPTYSISRPVIQDGGVLTILQEYGPGVSEADGTIPLATSVATLRLRLSCEGPSGHIDSIVPVVSGATLASPITDIDLASGAETVVDVLVDSSLASAGDLVSVYVTEVGVSSTFDDVQVIGGGVKAYVATPPPTIEIDGAFGDWEGLTTPDFDAVDNPDVDISAVGAVNSTLSSYFYVSVVGEIFNGSYVPVVIGKPIGGGGGVVIPTKKTGEDMTRIYVDSDMDITTGMPLSVVSKTIGADYKIEIKGLDGIIGSKIAYQYSSGAWVASSAIVSAENDNKRVEIGLSAAAIGGSSDIDFIVETTDWQEIRDYATAVPSGSRAAAFASDPGYDRWIVDGPTTSWTATAQSFQRKLFYDGVNYWSFYFDGSNTVAKYSTDGGVTWTLRGQVFATTGVNKTSVWWDSANSVVYAVGDTGSSTRNVYLQMGTVTPSTHTILWAGSDSTVATSSFNEASKNAFISRDASGYVWVLGVNRTETTPQSRYDLSAFKSTVQNSISSWAYSGNMLNGDDTVPILPGSIVPAGTGSNVWAVYGYQGIVASRKFTGTWSAETQIYVPASPSGPGGTEYAPPVAVVDGNGVIHVVYGNGHEQSGYAKPFIYYVYNSGSAWSVPYRLDSVANTLGNKYPTISLNSATGNVYAFWIQTDVDAVGITIVGKRNVSGTWTSLTFGTQTTAPKQFLNSIYSAPSETSICWQWTQNTTTSPRQVLFDKIPEFDAVLVPAFAMLLVFIISARRIRRKERLA